MQVEADLSKLSEATTTQYLALIEQEERRRVRGSWFQRTCSVCVHGSALCVAVPVPVPVCVPVCLCLCLCLCLCVCVDSWSSIVEGT